MSINSLKKVPKMTEVQMELMPVIFYKKVPIGVTTDNSDKNNKERKGIQKEIHLKAYLIKRWTFIPENTLEFFQNIFDYFFTSTKLLRKTTDYVSNASYINKALGMQDRHIEDMSKFSKILKDIGRYSVISELFFCSLFSIKKFVRLVKWRGGYPVLRRGLIETVEIIFAKVLKWIKAFGNFLFHWGGKLLKLTDWKINIIGQGVAGVGFVKSTFSIYRRIKKFKKYKKIKDLKEGADVDYTSKRYLVQKVYDFFVITFWKKPYNFIFNRSKLEEVPVEELKKKGKGKDWAKSVIESYYWQKTIYNALTICSLFFSIIYSTLVLLAWAGVPNLSIPIKIFLYLSITVGVATTIYYTFFMKYRKVRYKKGDKKIPINV